MKLPLIAIVLGLLLSAGISRAQINLEWDPSPPAESITGYKVYQKIVTAAPVPPAGAEPPATPVPPTITWRLIGQSTVPRFTVQSVPRGTTVYAVTAFSPAGESLRSNEVSNTLFTPPGKLRIVTVTVTP